MDNKIINKFLYCSLFNYTVNSRWTSRISEVRIDFKTVNMNMVQKWNKPFLESINFYQPSFWVAFLTEIKIYNSYNLVIKRVYTFYFLISTLKAWKVDYWSPLPFIAYGNCKGSCSLTRTFTVCYSQSCKPAKRLSMHTETLTVKTVWMALFLRHGSYHIFLYSTL